MSTNKGSPVETGPQVPLARPSPPAVGAPSGGLVCGALVVRPVVTLTVTVPLSRKQREIPLEYPFLSSNLSTAKSKGSRPERAKRQVKLL